jgi:hypothetical protein
LVGVRLIRKVAARKASSQYLRGSMSKQCKRHLHNMAMFTLDHTILLVSMRARDVMRDANRQGVEFLIPSSPIGLYSKNLVPKLLFNEFLKFKKVFRNLKLVTKQIDPNEFTIIIDKTDIIVFATKGINGRPPHILVNKL